MTAMSSQPGGSAQQGYAFTDADFDAIASIAHAEFGLALMPSKKQLVYSRLARRLRALGLPDFASYRAFLANADNVDERNEMLSALTTNVTHFFRERHHFDFLRDLILPDLLKKARAGRAVRLWSAGCSTGQEPYSLAAVLYAADPAVASYDLKVLATDIDPKVLATAKAARYPAEQFASLSSALRSQLIGTTSEEDGHLTIRPEVRQLVSFGQLNLIQSWPMRRPFDVIFCRNVAIYFNKETQAELWSRYARVLTPGGHLMIGHSERMHGPAAASFTSVGITIYQRDAAPTTTRWEE